ncbi:MAG: Ig-like domain-containing protein [Nitrospirae bacterium]|nr:Ig-like domain-containing protein [Nitrospirota bacterium]
MKNKYGILMTCMLIAFFLSGCGCGGNDVTLLSIMVTPQDQTVVMGAAQQYTATGTYSDNTTSDITTLVTWSSSNNGVAVISNSTGSEGRAAAVFTGQAIITAESGSITGTATLTVAPALISIAVTPKDQTVVVGAVQQFSATGTYSDNTAKDITGLVVWTSSNAFVAVVSNEAGSKGRVSTTSTGTTAVTASLEGISGSAGLTVNPVPSPPPPPPPAAKLISIEVTPQNPTVRFGTSIQFKATGLYDDGASTDITQSALWSSSDETIATISNTPGSKGLATTDHKVGNTTITATLDGVSGSTTLIDP